MARDAIEQIVARPVVAYRAPSFSIVQKSLWALEILRDEGFTLDSSVFPVRHDRYGIPGAERFLHRVTTQSGDLLEFPPSIFPFGRWNLPVGGGGYFRFYPYRATNYSLQSIHRKSGQPFMFYVHPWEVDPEQPRLPGSALSRFRHYVNLDRTEDRLHRLLSSYSFGPVGEVVAEQVALRQQHSMRAFRVDASRGALVEQTASPADTNTHSGITATLDHTFVDDDELPVTASLSQTTN